MKTSRSFFLVAFVLVAVSVSAGYSLNMTARVRELDRRLQRAESLLHSHEQALAKNTNESRIASLKQWAQRAELAASQASLISGDANPGLEQRVQNIERKLQPHFELLPFYEPAR